MLHWALIFLTVAFIAGVFGFGGIASASAGIAQILFFLFLMFFVGAMLLYGTSTKARQGQHTRSDQARR